MNRKFITLVVVGLLAFGVQLSLLVDSFPGFHGQGDCNLCHNLPATAYSSDYESSEITLDGNHSEQFWDGDVTQGRRVMVPVGGMYGGAHVFVSVIFAQNTTHLFILANWEDPTIDGTDSMKYSDSDGISFIWDINTTAFDTGYYGSGMSTENPGEATDMFTLKPTAAADGTETFGNDYTSAEFDAITYDQVMTDSGMIEDPTSSDYMWGARHGNISNHNEHNYQIEFARPLETGDVNDVQFNESRYYKFGIALYNNSAGAAHWVSPVHEVFVYNVNDPNNSEVTIIDYPVTDVDTVTDTETVINEVNVTVTETVVQTETEGKSPLSILPIMLALIAIPGIIVHRRRN